MERDAGAVAGSPDGNLTNDGAETPRDRFEALFEWMTQEAYGSWSKREVELKILSLHYGDRLAKDAHIPVGSLARELNVSRVRARQWLLDARTRAVQTDEDRSALMLSAVQKWTKRQIIDGDGRVKVTVDDPYVRDLLYTFAELNDITVDSSFRSEVLVLEWPSFLRLVLELVEGDARAELVQAFKAAMAPMELPDGGSEEAELSALYDKLMSPDTSTVDRVNGVADLMNTVVDAPARFASAAALLATFLHLIPVH